MDIPIPGPHHSVQIDQDLEVGSREEQSGCDDARDHAVEREILP